jgi:hypothetical protein
MRRLDFELRQRSSDRSRRVRRAAVQAAVVVAAVAILQKAGPSGISELALVPLNLDFGGQPVGSTSQPRDATIVNTGAAPDTPRTISVEGGDADGFVVPTACAGSELAPRSFCTVSVRFQPRHPGEQKALLRVVSESGRSETLRLSGTGVESAVLAVAPSLLRFGAEVRGAASDAQSASVTNYGAGPISLTWDGPQTLGGFVADPGGCLGEPLARGAECRIEVRFVATGGTTSSAAVIVREPAAAGQPARLSLGGPAKSGAGRHLVALVGRGRSQEPAILVVEPAAGGRVTSRPGGLTCPGTCTLSAAVGAEVELTAEADPGWTFSQWSSKDCDPSPSCRFALPEGRTTISASFKRSEEPPRELTVVFSNAAQCPGHVAAEIVSDPSGISCITQPATLAPMIAARAVRATKPVARVAPGVLGCSKSFPRGTQVRLVARLRGPGSIVFQPPCKATNQCLLKLDSDTQVTARICASPGLIQ